MNDERREYVEALEGVAKAAREYATVTNQGWPVPRQVAEATQGIRDAIDRLGACREHKSAPERSRYVDIQSVWFYLGVWHRSVGHGAPTRPPCLPQDATTDWIRGWTDADQVKVSEGESALYHYGADAIVAVKRLCPAEAGT